MVARRTLRKIRRSEWNPKHLNRPLYRSKEQRSNIMKDDKGTWFRKMGATSKLMVPTTKDSFLAKKMRMILASNPGPRGTSTKVDEVPRPVLFTRISVNNPFLSFNILFMVMSADAWLYSFNMFDLGG